MKRGTPFVISAPSGAGKSTLAKMLLSEFPSVQYSISCTTRPMRQGEAHGRDYYFISCQEFARLRAEGQFAEWARVHGHFYGTPLAPVREKLSAGADLLFDVDVQGAARIKMALPEACFIFILPPSLKELEARLARRGLDDASTIRQRLAHARAEITEAMWYDYIILNADLDQAYSHLRSVYIAASLTPARHACHLEALLGEGQ